MVGICSAMIMGIADFMQGNDWKSDAYTYLFAFGCMYVPVTIAFIIFDPKAENYLQLNGKNFGQRFSGFLWWNLFYSV